MKTSIVPALILIATQMAFGDEPPRKPVQSESTNLYPFGPGGEIRFTNSSGYLIIEGWDRQEVEVTVVKTAAATERLQGVSVNVEHPSAEKLQISTEGRGRMDLKYHIYAPRDSRIVVNHREGFILVMGMTGDIDAASRRGDIMLMLPDPASYAIDARNKFGLVTPDVAGTTKHKYVIGEQFTRDHAPTAHHMRLRMGFGGITIKEVPIGVDSGGRGSDLRL